MKCYQATSRLSQRLDESGGKRWSTGQFGRLLIFTTQQNAAVKAQEKENFE